MKYKQQKTEVLRKEGISNIGWFLKQKNSILPFETSVNIYIYITFVVHQLDVISDQKGTGNRKRGFRHETRFPQLRMSYN